MNRGFSQGGFRLFISTSSAPDELDGTSQNGFMNYCRSVIFNESEAGDTVVCGSATSSADLVWGRVSARSQNRSALQASPKLRPNS
jgi:hypothetical protein